MQITLRDIVVLVTQIQCKQRVGANSVYVELKVRFFFFLIAHSEEN